MTEPRIALTGGSGFIGGALARRLEKSGMPFRQFGREDLDEIAGFEPDVLVHLASPTPKARGEGDDEAMVDGIALLTRDLLTRLGGRADVVFGSTLDVYADSGNAPIDERSPIGPTDVYGAAKVLAEELVRARARRTGTNAMILRIGHVYGPGEAAYRKLIPETIRTALAGSPVSIHGDSRALRDFVFVDDVARALEQSLMALRGVETVNIATGQSVEIAHVATLICELTGASPPTLRQDGHRRDYVFDTAKMRDLLGTWDFTPLRDGLAAEIAWFRRLH